MRTRLSALLLALPALSSCTVHPIRDLRFIEASRTSTAAIPGVPLTRERAAFRLSFEGGAQWVRTIRGHQMNGYPVVVRCDDRNSELFALGPFVGNVPVAHGNDSFEAWDHGDRRTLRYDIYLPGTGRYRSAADFNAPMPEYDLARDRIELCVRLGGGAMTGFRARSNEVRVAIGGPG